MKPTERARLHIERIFKLGVTQKVVAARLGVSESTFSRWYHRKPDSKGRKAKLPADALDALDAYLEEFAAFAKETQPATASPEPTTATARKPFQKRG